MTGIAQLPHGTACSIFFSLPDPNAPPTWHYLGYLTNDKPSAIYKLTNLTKPKPDSEASQPVPGFGFNYVQSPVIHLAQIGISVEPIDSVLQMVPAIETVASNKTTFAEFINKTIGNLYNYCSSFSRPANEIVSNPFSGDIISGNAQYVPLTTLRNWYENYTRRLNNDQNFWRTLN